MKFMNNTKKPLYHYDRVVFLIVALAKINPQFNWGNKIL